MKEFPAGQPPKIKKPGVKEKLLFALDKGASYQICCGFAGIAYQTFREWIKRGESISHLTDEEISQHPDKIYYDFIQDVRSVESNAALKWLDKIDAASKFHWQAAAWKLERRYPNVYGKAEPEREKESEDEIVQKARDEVNKLKGDDNGRSSSSSS